MIREALRQLKCKDPFYNTLKGWGKLVLTDKNKKSDNGIKEVYDYNPWIIPSSESVMNGRHFISAIYPSLEEFIKDWCENPNEFRNWSIILFGKLNTSGIYKEPCYYLNNDIDDFQMCQINPYEGLVFQHVDLVDGRTTVYWIHDNEHVSFVDIEYENICG